jgi:hypothetical protein
MSPVHGWLRDILPLVDVGGGLSSAPGHEKALTQHRAIHLAEEARRKGNHQEMVEQRRILKETDPEVFEEYLVRLRSLPVK